MKIIAIGRNYLDHARELNSPVPDEPVFFMKSESSIIRNNKPFFYPPFSKKIHFETEIILRICKVGKNISPRFAPRYFDKISLGIDFTARDIQDQCKKQGLPWEKAKAFDGSAPIGKWINKTEYKNIDSLNFSLLKNGNTMQTGNTRDMIFHYHEIISYVSRFLTLKMGDIIFTGTPAGVGPVEIGDRLTALLEDRIILDFFIR